MCTLILILTLGAGEPIITRISDLPCPEDDYTAKHWIPENSPVTSINTVTIK